jgi:tetratricopeptide (TPR) repeat protein
MTAVLPHFQPKSKAQYALMMLVLLALAGCSIYIIFYKSEDRTTRGLVLQKAATLREDRRFDDAVALLLAQIQEEEKSAGPQDPRLVKLMDLLAMIYGEQGKDAAAEPYWRRVLEIRRKALGAEHPEVYGSADKLGVCLKNQGKFAEAEPLLRRSLAIREKNNGPDDAILMPSLHRLASLCLAQKKYAEAEAFARRAMAIARGTIGLVPASFADAQLDLAAALSGQDKLDEAEPLYLAGLAMKEAQLPKSAHIPAKPGMPSPGDVAELWREYGAALRKGGKIREAAAADEKARVILVPPLKDE